MINHNFTTNNFYCMQLRQKYDELITKSKEINTENLKLKKENDLLKKENHELKRTIKECNLKWLLIN